MALRKLHIVARTFFNNSRDTKWRQERHNGTEKVPNGGKSGIMGLRWEEIWLAGENLSLASWRP